MKKITLVASLAFTTSHLFAIDFVNIKNEILLNYPEIEKAKSDFNSSIALARPGQYSLFPTLSASAKRDWMDFKEARSTHQDFYGLTGSLNLFKSGADFYSIRAANAQIDKAESLYRLTVLKTESDVTKALFDYIKESQTLKIAELRFESKKNILSVAEIRSRKGLIPQEELDKVAIELGQAEAQYMDAQQAYIETRNQILGMFKDEKAKALINSEPQWPWKSFISDTQLLNKVPSADLSSTPGYQSALYDLNATEHLKSKALGLMGPSLDLVTTYGKTKSTGTWQDTWTLSLSLTLPLFEKLQSFSTYKQQSHNVAAAQSEVMIAQRDGALAIENSKVKLELARLTALSRTQMAEKSKKLYTKSMQLFKAGRINVNDLGLDEDRWLLSQSLEIQGWASAHLALLNYYQARGLPAHDTKLRLD